MDTDGCHGAAAARAGILKLPSKIRKEIFRLVLVVPHEIHIFRDPGGPIGSFAPDKPLQWRALLLTNHVISREAEVVIYGLSTFNFMDVTTQQAGLLDAFIQCIGPQNAGLVSHVCINFPVIEDRAGTLELQGDSLHTLHLLRENCRSLRVLELHVHGKISNYLTKADKDDAALIDHTLSSLFVKLQTFVALQRVVVRFFVGRPTPSAMRVMLGYGWMVIPAYRKHW